MEERGLCKKFPKEEKLIAQFAMNLEQNPPYMGESTQLNIQEEVCSFPTHICVIILMLIIIIIIRVIIIKAASSDERALARASYTQISTNQRKGRSCPMTPPTTLYVKLLQSYS